ncbi:MAG: secretin N-terminal domain-containing protein, partial [Halanaerobium sp.]
MIKIKKISIILLILIISFSAAAAAGPQDKIEDMNFKNSDVVDVLRTIAEVADVNLITDSEVSGDITVNLKDITFEKALDLITQTRSLSYEWDENTVVVAAPDRIDSIYDNIVTEYVEVSSGDFDNIATIVKEIFPETQITTDTPRQQFIIKGEEENVEEIRKMISKLDSTESLEAERDTEEKTDKAEVEEETVSESYKVLNAELDDLEEKIEEVFSEIEIKKNSLTKTITISGSEEDVKEAISMTETYDQSLEPETRNIRVDYVDTEQITEIVDKFYPDVRLHVNEKRKEIIINGAKNKLDGVVDLVEEINIPQDQVIIEVRVEEVSTDKLKELGVDLQNGSLSRLHFIKDQEDPSLSEADSGEFGQIEGIELTWPDFLRAINDDNDSETLAKPSLMTLNGEEADMSITDEVPFPIRDDEGEISTYDYMEAGIELTFTPWITENDEIELSMKPEVSSFGAMPEEAELPPRKKRSVETNLRLNDGETFAIGGLIQEDEQKSMSKVPLLGDIPLLGELFKSRSDDNSRTELLIFVTPRIIKHGEEYAADEHLIESGLEKDNSETETDSADNQDPDEDKKIESASTEKNKEEIIAEYLQERSKSREEIMAALREGKEEKNKSFNDL